MAKGRDHDRDRKNQGLKGFSCLATALTVLVLPLLSQAQTSSAPLPVSGPAFARTATRFYIQGGTFANINYGQFFSLDLAVAWNNTSPAWTQLNDGPQQNIYPAVFSADQKTMITFHSGGATFAYRYSVTTGQWSPSSLQVGYGGYQGVGAVTDPNTGTVYLAGGYTDGSRNSMSTYNFNTDTMSQTAMPPGSNVFPNRAYYANTWSQKRGSIIYFGGYNATLNPIPDANSAVEFVPATGTWRTLSTSGTPPTMRADHCMTSNEDGSIVVIYGGRPVGNAPFSGEVFILDTVNLVWKQGLAGPPRIYATCTIAGDQLLIWGGVDGSNVVAPGSVNIYSLTSNTWATQYTPPASYVAARASESSPTPTSTAVGGPTGSVLTEQPSTINAGAIAGGVVGGVAVICAIVLVFIFRRNKHKGSPISTTGDRDDMHESKQPPSAEPCRGDDELERLRLQLQNQQEQLDLQRRLLQLQQQQQLQMPLQQPQHQYQDTSYNYQPPIFYSACPPADTIAVTSPGITMRSSPGSTNIPIHNVMAHSGYVDGNNQYAGTQQVVGYSPPHAEAPAAILADKTPLPMVAIGAKHDSNFWEERPPGNPHAVIES
ncbi:hypothetical protein BGX28_008223 [Mortierella sp. GBA30]|nr:hypothetical protein BGX28_008223 [Mortierella sp. GBA30]